MHLEQWARLLAYPLSFLSCCFRYSIAGQVVLVVLSVRFEACRLRVIATVQVRAQAPAASPASSEDLVLKDLIVLCPIKSTTEVQSLSIQSMEPTDTTTQTSTQYAGYMYQSVNALGGLTTCTGTESQITAGKAPRPLVTTALLAIRQLHYARTQHSPALGRDPALQALHCNCRQHNFFARW